MADTTFTVRRKILTLFGAQFHIYQPDGSLLGYCRQKAFKLKEDIRIYTDEKMTTEKLAITARSIIDMSASYDVVESATKSKIGALQRKGFSSILRDSWVVRNQSDAEIGKIQEDSQMMALVRRFLPLGNMVPQSFHLKDTSNAEFASYRTHFHPFVHRMTVTVHENCPVNPLLVLASAVLLMAIEGRQS